MYLSIYTSPLIIVSTNAIAYALTSIDKALQITVQNSVQGQYISKNWNCLQSIICSATNKSAKRGLRTLHVNKVLSNQTLPL